MDTEISENAKVFAAADWAYRSRTFFGVGNPNTIQPGYSVVNATLGLGSADDEVRVSVFVRNLFDKRFAAIIFPGFFDLGQVAQILPDNAFRRVGVVIDWRF